MSRLWPTALLLLASGCLGGGVETKPEAKEEMPTLSPQMRALQHRIKSLEYFDSVIRDQFDKLYKRHVKEIQEIKDRLVQVEKATSHLIQNLERLGTGREHRVGPEPPAGPKTTDGKPPKVKPVVDKDTAIAEAIQRMKGPLPPAAQQELAERLLPFASEALPKLLAELRTPRTNLQYVRNFTAVASRFPPQILHRPMEEALRDPSIRGFIAEAIGHTRNRALGSLLLKYRDTKDETFRSHVAEALARCKHIDGVRMLIEQLNSTDPAVRTIALLTLKDVSGGLTHGFRPELDPTVQPNVDSIKRWENWFKANETELFRNE